jgi:phage repressor protein C with HTH and peptisase S24 domain
MHNDNHKGIGQRLRLEMKKKGLAAAEVARRADVKTSFLYDVISGKSANPSSIKLARVAESLGVNLTYLAGTSDSPHEGYQFSLPPQLQDYVSIRHVTVQEGKLSAYEDPQENFRFRKDWVKKKIGVEPVDLRIFTVTGDNMHPTLAMGDTLLVDTTRKHPSPAGIFLLFDGIGLVAKRVELIAHTGKAKLRISCDNPHYAPYESLIEDSAIIGRVSWFSREL